MVRTKADGGGASGSRKAIGGNAPRKALGGAGPSTSSADSPSGKNVKFAGGNPVCARPTPDWQKGIGMFLSPSKSSSNKENSEPDNDIDMAESSTVQSSKEDSSSTSMETCGTSEENS